MHRVYPALTEETVTGNGTGERAVTGGETALAEATYRHDTPRLSEFQSEFASFHGLHLRSSPLSSMMSNAHMKTLASWRRYLIRSNNAMPSSPQATASPSMMHERERRHASPSTISGKRFVRSLPGRLNSLTRLSSFRAMTLRKTMNRPSVGGLHSA